MDKALHRQCLFLFMKSQNAIPFEIIHLNEEGYHLRITSKINDLKISMILDTGASQTAFDQHFIRISLENLEINLAEQISTGLGTNSMESFECILHRFEIGNIELTNYKAALLDLSHVNYAYEKLNIEPIQGVLGNDVLLKFNALIDYKNKQIWLDN